MFRDLRVGLWVLFKIYFKQMNIKQMKNKNSLRHIHKKTPAEFSPQGSVSFQFEGSIHFDEGAFPSVVNRRNRDEPFMNPFSLLGKIKQHSEIQAFVN